MGHHLLWHSTTSKFGFMAGFIFYDRDLGFRMNAKTVRDSLRENLRGILHQISGQRSHLILPLLEAEASNLVFAKDDAIPSLSPSIEQARSWSKRSCGLPSERSEQKVI